MLLRIRWFILGAVASVGFVTYLANQLRRARERLTPRNLANTGMRSVAEMLDTAADVVAPADEGQR